jgi:hypothetical protein
MPNSGKQPNIVFILAHESVQRGIRAERHKLVEYAVNGSHRMQLFDMENDPHDLARRLEIAALESGDIDSPWGRQFWSVARKS